MTFFFSFSETGKEKKKVKKHCRSSLTLVAQNSLRVAATKHVHKKKLKNVHSDVLGSNYACGGFLSHMHARS